MNAKVDEDNSDREENMEKHGVINKGERGALCGLLRPQQSGDWRLYISTQEAP